MPHDALLTYYERELSHLRSLGQEFAQAYPKVAGRLLLEAGKCEDPHVERLIQAVAFLTARIQHKLDDEFPEVTDALLGILYPHYLAPIPSVSIAQFVLDPEQGKVTSGYSIPRHKQIFSRPVEGVQCSFRTAYPVTLWPIDIVSARMESEDVARWGKKVRSVLRLALHCTGGTTFRDLQLESLRLYLHGESQLAHMLYELLLNDVHGLRLREAGNRDRDNYRDVVLPPDHIKPVGFERDEGLLAYPSHAQLGYRLLHEYFAFPQKFLFVDLTGLRQVCREVTGSTLEVLIGLERVPRQESAIGPDNFRLGCTPVVNLFEQLAEPIRLDQTQMEYRVVPDVRRPNGNEVYSINAVSATSAQSERTRLIQPIYALSHRHAQERQANYWYAVRRQSTRKDDTGSEMYLSLVDLEMQMGDSPGDTLLIETTCTNRDLPGRLRLDEARGDFELEEAAPIAKIRALVKPTSTVRPPLSAANRWRLISHLSLNYLSLSDGSTEALQEILRLYDFSDSSVSRQQIDGIEELSSTRVVRRPSSMGWHGFCRGLDITLLLDEDKYVGSGVFLFASVLERFLGLYANLNSFTQLTVKTRQREKALKQWPPRAGEQILL
jgi:type VI secretion system protein ImpG